MTELKSKKMSKKVILIASLGIIIPVFIVSMAFVAVRSDAENQAKYRQQQKEMMEKIKQKQIVENVNSEVN